MPIDSAKPPTVAVNGLNIRHNSVASGLTGIGLMSVERPDLAAFNSKNRTFRLSGRLELFRLENPETLTGWEVRRQDQDNSEIGINLSESQGVRAVRPDASPPLELWFVPHR